MKNKSMVSLLVTFIFLSSFLPQARAEGFKQATASLLLPTTGQTMNGQFSTTKTKVMAGVEVAAVTTVAVIGIASGGAIIWAGLGPLIANHLWSATDAYKNAQVQQDPMIQQQMVEAQRALDLSRQRRFERVQNEQSNVRRRIEMAGEQAY